jgi:Family of unknown function (DUF6807)
MRMVLIGVIAFGLFVAQPVLLRATEIVVSDTASDEATKIALPVNVQVDLAKLSGMKDKSGSLRLVEVGKDAQQAGKSIPAQFEPDWNGSSCGTLWWLMPAGPKGERRFRLLADSDNSSSGLSAKYDTKLQCVDITEGDKPVLRYNHGMVPPPPEIVERFEKKRNPPWYYARGNYIHPLFGPDGEKLTDDYSLNHPHHRGIFWSWPVLRYKGEVRDIWAVRVMKDQPGGAWARPVAMRQICDGPVFAFIDAENVWKWGDEVPIVREEVLIRAFRSNDRCRFLDIEVRLTALADDVLIGGRPKAGYGGFTFRTLPEFDKRKIALHIDPPGTSPQKAWLHLTGNMPGSKGPIGVALMEHVTNAAYPNYPSPKDSEKVPFGQYPPWRAMTPAFPGDREVALSKDKPLVLKHRIWVHPGTVDDDILSQIWADYAEPVKARIVD